MITASKRSPQEETTKSTLAKGESIQLEDKQLDQERTLALLHSSNHLGDVVQHIESNGFAVVMRKEIQFTLDQAKEFYADHINQNYYDKMLKWLSSSTITALVLEKQDAVKDWRQLMGPTNYKKARKANPNSIRALFGKDASQNATHGSDSDVSACKEINFIFNDGVSFLVDDTTNNEVRMHTIENETIANDTKKETEQSQNNAENDLIQDDDAIHVPESMATVMSEVHTESDGRDDETCSVDVQNDAQAVSQDQSPAVMTLVKDKLDTDNSYQEETVIVAAEDIEAISTNSTEGTSVNKDDLEEVNSSVATTHNEVTIEEEPAECHLEATQTENQEEHAQTKEDAGNENQSESTAEVKETELVVPVQENKEEAVTTKNENVTHNGEEEIGVGSLTECNETQEKEESIPTTITLESKETLTSSDSHIGEAEESGDQIGKEKDVVNHDMKVELEESIQEKEPICVKENITTTDKKTPKKPKEGIAVSTSRIRPPSVKGQISETMRNPPPSKVNSRPASIKSGTGTTRIARLSPSVTINKETENKKAETSRESASPSVAKKAVTKVSKNLPRVAKMSIPKPTETKENEEVEKKPKKRMSSTKSFISRLTTPTVASANKKAEADTPVTNNVPKRSSLPSKRTSTVGPAVSTSKDIPSRLKQKKNTTVTNGIKQKQATSGDSTTTIPN